MKKKFFLLLISIFTIGYICGQENEVPVEKIPSTEGIFFTEGAITSNITRVIFNSGKNNYVYQNKLIGGFLEIESKNLPVNLKARLAGYYPYKNLFNGIEMISKQVVLYGIEGFIAPVFNLKQINNFSFNVATGGHIMYQLSDEYHLIYVGLGIEPIIEFNLFKYCTFITSATAFIDYANLGSNRLIQPFDLVYQYQVAIGFRFSIKNFNYNSFF